MNQNHVNILICTPGRSMESEYVKSLVETIQYLNANNISFIYLNEYSSQVSAARESTIMGSKILSAFETRPISGHATYDKIIWIDSDMSWTIQDFIKLYESKYDIVSGVYFGDQGVPMFAFEEEQIYFDSESIKGKQYPFEIFAAGFGFIAMKSGVFENLQRPWFETVYQKIEKDGKEMFIPWGEDYSWCKKAKDSGYKIYLDPSIRLGHHKKMKI